jgi:uncharacterized protein YlxW (UPF0749 family)
VTDSTLVTVGLAVAGLILTGLGLGFTVMTAMLAVLVRLVVRFTRVEDRQTELMADVRQLVEDKDEAHRQLAATLEATASKLDSRQQLLEDRIWRQRTERGRHRVTPD